MKVWFDCTAAAHPLVLGPVIDRFKARGDDVLVTTREYGQTIGILDRLGIEYTVVGAHGGGSKFALVSLINNIPSAQLQDYEFAGLQRQVAFRIAKRVLVPDSIPPERMAKVGAKGKKLVQYPGLKEDYYLAGFQPDPAVITELGLDRENVLVVVRPPPETSEYHADNPLYEEVIQRLDSAPGVTAVIIPRTEGQGARIRGRGAPNLIVPERAIDAQSLITFADLVVSAGGTMNREAVALGTPVYTTFAGLESADQLELVKRTARPETFEGREADILVEGILGAMEGKTAYTSPPGLKSDRG